jgi:ribose/xylose/arabinose/galactoside ABC-type transport system permease subunit
VATVDTRQAGKGPVSLLKRLVQNEGIALAALLGVVIIFFAFQTPSAREVKTYLDLLREVSPNLIAAVGITLLLLAGELDVSIGSMLAFTGVATVLTFNATGNMWLGILVGILTGPLVGAIHGYLVTVQRMNSLVTTLGTLFTLRGLVYIITNKTPVVDENGFTEFNWLYQGDLGPLPVPFALALVIIVIFFVVLTQTEFGRQIYAIGGNQTAARVSGIKVERVKFSLFIIASTMAALAGLLICAQTGTGYFDAGASGFELVVIAAVVLGGVNLFGGEGRLVSAMIGVLILGITSKGLRLLNVPTTWELVVTGGVMMAAVYFHIVRKKLQSRKSGS